MKTREVNTDTEKVLLYTYQSDLRATEQRAKNAETEINHFVKRVESELKRELNKDEKLKLIQNAPAFLEQSIAFTLPNAPQSLKYEAMGFNISEIKKLWNARKWGNFEFLQDSNGHFQLTDPQPMYEVHKRYAGPRQLEVLEQAKTLADALNVAVSQGLNSVPVPYKVWESFKVVRFNESEKQFKPDLEHIALAVS